MIEAVGWSASALLVCTIFTQLHRQWRLGHSSGVSPWLYVGQSGASGLFLVYSWLIGSAVFIATKLVLLCAALAGLALTLRHRRSAATLTSAQG